MPADGSKRKQLSGKQSLRRAPAPGNWPASTCDCPDCRQACQNSPGWFLPGQIEPLARVLGRSPQELFRACLALGTTQMPTGKRMLGVMPHKLRDFKKPGQIWALNELADPGRCIFYEHGKCAIYDVRPYECSRMHHSHTARQTHELRHFIVRQWNREALAPYLAWARGRPSGKASRRR